MNSTSLTLLYISQIAGMRLIAIVFAYPHEIMKSLQTAVVLNYLFVSSILFRACNTKEGL